MNIPVIYEDDSLLIVNKPQGLLTISTPKNERYTLTGILNEDLKKKGTSYRLHPCHRLDRDTSGLVIYAKGKSIQKKIRQLFKQEKIKKIYVAFLQGRLFQNKGNIDYPIEGKHALTKYRVVEKRKDFSIVEIEPKTGRTNQIRIHFKALGYPIVGEKKFAFRRDYKLKANRLCLYAKELEFIHPLTKKIIFVTAKLPTGMKNFLEKHPI